MRSLSLGLVMMLMACAPGLAPRGTETATPVLGDDALLTRDGLHLPLRRWEVQGAPKAVIVALHGMGDYSNAFAMPGAVWAKQGITTIAYDQRGFGAGPNRGLWGGADAMRDDLNDAVAAAHARYPGVPVYALGESMGGAVVLTALASANPPPVDGVVLVAPAVWSRADMPLTYRLALFFTAHFLPDMVLPNSAASKVVTIVPSDNVPMLRAMSRDPLVQKETRTGALYGLVNLMDEARNTNPAHPPPILLLTGAHDQIIPKPPTDVVIAALGAKAEVKRYPNGYHMLLRDLEGESVDNDVSQWVRTPRN